LNAVASKVFEEVILQICEQRLVTDDLQFGFNIRRSKQMQFLLSRLLLGILLEWGSVYCAALDLSKAFDLLNRYILFKTLICVDCRCDDRCFLRLSVIGIVK
jgi:hypothetical protein